MNKQNPMYVATLYGSSLSLYTDILGSAPCKLFTNPILFLSAPEELIDLEVAERLCSEVPPVLLIGKPTIFRNVFNPITNFSTFVAGFQMTTPKDMPLSKWRASFLHVSKQIEFIPYMELIPDAMQSRSVRSYSNAIQNALAKYEFELQVQLAYPDNPKHDYLYKTFNSLVAEQLGSSFGNLV